MNAKVRAAVKKAGQSTTSGKGCSGKCKDCSKEGLAIYLALQAAGPASAVAKLPRPNDLLLDSEPVVTLSDHSRYFVRPLRQGYVYVFKEGEAAAQQWDCYYVSPEARLTLTSVASLASAADEAAKAAQETCTRPEHNAFFPQFITVNPKVKKIWVAFSTSVWSQSVLDDYAADKAIGDIGPCRTARMQPLDLAAIKARGNHKGVLYASEQALADSVAGFKKGDIGEVENSRLNCQIPRHDDQAGEIAQRMAQAGKSMEHPGAIFSLCDTAGITAELNWQRQRVLAERAVYQSKPEIAWKWLSAQSIGSLRDRIHHRKKAEVVQRKTGQPLGKENNPKLVLKSRELIYRQQFEQWKKAGTIPPGAEFRPEPPNQPNSYVGRVWVPPDSLAANEARSDIFRLEGQYSEDGRKKFLDEYAAELKKYDDQLEKLEKEWHDWLWAKPQPGRPDLLQIARLDHRDTDKLCLGDYIYLSGQCIGMGPLSPISLPWFKEVLSYKITDDRQIMMRSLMGNQRSLIAWADQEKKDKIYDTLKGIHQAGDIKASKWMAIPIAGYANSSLNALTATAMLLNKNGSLDKGAKDAMTKFVCAALKLWDGLEIGFIKIARARIGDLQQGLLAAAFARSVAMTDLTQALGKGPRLAAKAKLPATVSDKTIDALLWTAGKTGEIDTLLKGLPATTSAESRAISTVMTAENSLKKMVSATNRKIPAGATRDFVSRVVKSTDGVAGSANIILAAGVIYIQWFSAVQNLDAATKVGGAGQMDALLGLGDACFSIVGASAELLQGFKTVQAIATKVAVTEGLKLGVRVIANGAAGVANLFSAVQSFGASYRQGSEGDTDARNLHFLAGLAFVGAAAASFALAAGAKAVFFGSMLGLGPVGWAVILTVVAVGLTYAALTAEDTEAEKHVARNAFWSKHKRPQDKAFNDWQDEANSFQALWYGVTVDLDWGDSLISGDTLAMSVKIAEPEDAQGWRYRIWVTFPDGKEEVVAVGADRVPSLQTERLDWADKLAGNNPKDPAKVIAGRDIEVKEAVVSKENGAVQIERVILLDENKFNKGRMEFDYFPDADDTDKFSHLKREAKD